MQASAAPYFPLLGSTSCSSLPCFCSPGPGCPACPPPWLAPVISGHWGVGPAKGTLLTTVTPERRWKAAWGRALPQGSHHIRAPLLCTHHTDSEGSCLSPCRWSAPLGPGRAYSHCIIFLLGGFKQQKCIVSQFWRLEVHNQGVGRAMPLRRL